MISSMLFLTADVTHVRLVGVTGQVQEFLVLAQHRGVDQAVFLEEPDKI